MGWTSLRDSILVLVRNFFLGCSKAVFSPGYESEVVCIWCEGVLWRDWGYRGAVSRVIPGVVCRSKGVWFWL